MALAVLSHVMGNYWEITCFSHVMKYTIKWESDGKKRPYYGTSMSTNFPGSPHTMGFIAFSYTMENWWGNSCISHMMKHTVGWESYGKNHPYYGKSMSTNFPGSPHTMGFVAFSRTMRNWWGTPCISHMMKYTIGWESNGKKYPYYGKSMSNFPDFPHTMGFVAFSHTVGNLCGNPYISHMLKYTIGWESNGKKEPMLWEKYDCGFPRLSPYHGLCCIFLYYEKFMGKPMHFQYDDIG